MAATRLIAIHVNKGKTIARCHEINLRRRLGEDIAVQPEERPRDFDIVLDIQKIIAKNKGANYERWAKSL